jgi:hypothetical protein
VVRLLDGKCLAIALNRWLQALAWALEAAFGIGGEIAAQRHQVDQD